MFLYHDLLSMRKSVIALNMKMLAPTWYGSDNLCVLDFWFVSGFDCAVITLELSACFD